VTLAADNDLIVDDLARRYGPRWVLSRVSFRLPAGGSCMVTGNNGSGKTTLLRCLATALKPHHGKILLGGRDLWRTRGTERARVAFLSHATRLYEDLDARGNLRTWARFGTDPVDIDGTLRRVGLNPANRDPARAFSAGMRRRLALGRVLIKRPALLLLDEPFTALDPQGRELLIDIVREIQRSGTTLVLATHLPDVSRRLCTLHLHMDDGRVVSQSETTAAAP
jgi:heme exporter protein A